MAEKKKDVKKARVYAVGGLKRETHALVRKLAMAETMQKGSVVSMAAMVSAMADEYAAKHPLPK